MFSKQNTSLLSKMDIILIGTACNQRAAIYSKNKFESVQFKIIFCVLLKILLSTYIKFSTIQMEYKCLGFCCCFCKNKS